MEMKIFRFYIHYILKGISDVLTTYIPTIHYTNYPDITFIIFCLEILYEKIGKIFTNELI